MKTVILISGYKRSGKDTVADMIADKVKNPYRLSYAAAMKDILADTLGLTLEELEDKKNDSNYQHRSYLQRFGQKAKEYFGENCWGDIVGRTIQHLPDDSVIIISDFRMPIEAIEGAITVRVTNDRVKNNDKHISETALDNFEFDYLIQNNGTLGQLEDNVEDLLGRLRVEGKI